MLFMEMASIKSNNEISFQISVFQIKIAIAIKGLHFVEFHNLGNFFFNYYIIDMMIKYMI